jgi:hypothetical protein
MSKWLFDPGTRIPERLLELIDNLPEDRKYFYPFKDKEFKERFDSYIKQYKNSLTTFPKRYSKLKKNLRVYLNKTSQTNWWTAEAGDNVIIFYKKFFNKKRYKKLIWLEHELTHIVQDLITENRILIKFSLKWGNLQKVSSEYYNNRFEIEPWTKDFYYEILRLRELGKLKTQASVKKWLSKDKHFKYFSEANQKRILQKILSNL